MKLPAHARRLAILAGLGIILSFGSARVRADEPQVSPDEALRRVAESLEAADVPPETRGRILDLIRSRQAAKPNDGPGAGEAGDEGGGPQPAPERAQRPASPGRDPQAIREKLMRDRQIFWERLRQAALEADREAEEARLRAERLRAHAERAMSAAAQADRGEDPLGGEAERGGRPGGPGMDPFGPPRQAGGFEIGIVFDLRKGEQLAIAEVADGSAAEVGGVRRGDQVLRADGEELNSPEQLAAAVQRAGAEQRPLELVVRRGEEELELQVRPAPRRQSISPWTMPPVVGPWPGPGMFPGQPPQAPQAHGPQAHGPQAHGPQGPGNFPGGGMTPPQVMPPLGGPGGMMGGGMPWQRDLDGLRQEVESLRRELRELRELLQQPQKPPVAEPAVLSF